MPIIHFVSYPGSVLEVSDADCYAQHASRKYIHYLLAANL